MRRLVVFLLALPLAVDAQPAAPPPERFLRTWQGTLAIGDARLRLGLEVVRDAGGALRGTLTSIDQGGQRIPATVTTRGDTLLVDVSAIQAGYTATLSAAGDSLRGTFRQGAGALPLAMGRVAALPTPRRPQEPTPPFPYRAEEVTFESVPNVRLAGTLRLPQGAGPFPAAVFVTGAGPEDRETSAAGHRPFVVLADHLARHGIASLHVDDRGWGRSTGSFAGTTSADFAGDAEAAVRFLRGHPAVRRDRVGLVGHSEGGLIAPMVAARSRDVAFLVLLAGPGVRADSLLALQTPAVLRAAGADSATVARGLATTRQIVALARSDTDLATVAARAREAVRELRASLPAGMPLAAVTAVVQQSTLLAEMAPTPWFRYFVAHDPAPALRRVRVPVLALNGTLDLQVAHRENLAAIEEALRAGGNRDVRTVALPRGNHQLQTATTGLATEVATIDETVAPAVLDLVAGWIGERFVRR